ncbi:(2Fe-2S)-binding protein [Candidatus Amoebophilus asiaticus]|uniref:(2Fe-2S)-binding protein n=1 Tax=Candidatus Amoebophilus asiaticus TaxID=281120 RepID=UPI0001715D45|nr:(2Fe-2S)-binding protein [Candidatus Amoebophilus asiaticus]
MDAPYYATSTHNIFSKDIDTIIVAGNNHKTGQPLLREHIDHFISTEQYIKQHYGVDTIQATWSAQHYKTADSIPYIGPANRSSKRIYVATGYATDGLIYGTVAGIILSDLVIGKENSWASVYNSNRFTPIASFGSFVKENLNTSLYYLLGYVRSMFERKLAAIKPGEGKVISAKGKKVAAYRNKDGTFKIVSAVCTHMRCIVAWNGAEKSWDCPCHGSRFSVDGNIIEGPALDPLHKITP